MSAAAAAGGGQGAARGRRMAAAVSSRWVGGPPVGCRRRGRRHRLLVLGMLQATESGGGAPAASNPSAAELPGFDAGSDSNLQQRLQPAAVPPRAVVHLMQPPPRLAQVASQTGTASTSARPSSAASSSSSSRGPGAGQLRAAVPGGSRRLVWRADPAQSRGGSGGGGSDHIGTSSGSNDIKPRAQLFMGAWAGGAREASPAAFAAVATRVRSGSGSGGGRAVGGAAGRFSPVAAAAAVAGADQVVVSLGSMGPLLLPPYPNNNNNNSGGGGDTSQGEGEPHGSGRGRGSRRSSVAAAGGVGGGGGELHLFGLISRCCSWRDLERLHREHSGRLLPDHIPALMAAAAKMARQQQQRQQQHHHHPHQPDHHHQPDYRHPRHRGPGQDQWRPHPHPAQASKRVLEQDANQQQLLSYVWELAGSALRLARSRELPPRGLATAMWAVAKLPLPPLRGRGGGGGGGGQPPAAAGSPSPSPGLAQQQQQQQQPGQGQGQGVAGERPPPPRREEWLLWAREMVCCAASRPALLAGFSPQDVSQTLWALATLEAPLELEGGDNTSGGGGAAGPLPRGFLGALLEATQPRLGAFGPQALSNTLWALSRLRCQPPPAWLEAACAAALPQLRSGSFNAQALATTAAALAHLEYCPPGPEWWAAFYDACEQRMWPPGGSSHHHQQQGQQRCWEGRSEERTDQEGGGGAAPGDPVAEGAVRSTAAEGPRDRGWAAADAGAPQSLAQTAWAVARLRPRLRPPAAWLDGLVGASAAAAPRMNGLDVANLLWALGALGYRCGRGVDGRPTPLLLPGPLAVAPLLLAWLREVDSMAPQQLSACLVASVHLGLGLGRGRGRDVRLMGPGVGVGVGPDSDLVLVGGLVDRTLEAVGRRLPSAGGQAVANSLWAAARLGCRPPGAWMGAVMERFMAAVEDDDAGPQEVANVWWALGRLRWVPPADAASDLLSRSLGLVAAGDLRSGEVAMVLWALGRLGIRLPKPLIDRLVHIVRTSLAAEQQGEGEGEGGNRPHTQPGLGPGLRNQNPAWLGPRSAPAPPATLVTLLRALAVRQATSQRSTAMALLERSLRHMAVTLQQQQQQAREAREPREGAVLLGREVGWEGSGESAAAAAGAAAARQVAGALHSAAGLGVALSAESGRPGGGGSRGLAGAVVTALRAVLPYTNTRDLAMALAAVAAMEAAVPMGLLAAALQRAGELYQHHHQQQQQQGTGEDTGSEVEVEVEVGAAMAGVPDGGAGGGDRVDLGAAPDPDLGPDPDLAAIVCSLGRLLELHAEERARTERRALEKEGAGVEEAGRRNSNSSDSSGGRHSANSGVDGGGTDTEAGGDEAGGGGPGLQAARAASAAAAAAAQAAVSRWEELLGGRPRLAAARAVLLAAAMARLEGEGQGEGEGASPSGASAPSPSPSSSSPSSSPAATGAPPSPPPLRAPLLSAGSVQQLLLGCSRARLAPSPRLLRLMARALVRVAGELPAGLLAACLSHLAAMGADMDPRVARRLVGRMREVHVAAASSGQGRVGGRGWVAAACGGVSLLVAMWVLRGRAGAGDGDGDGALGREHGKQGRRRGRGARSERVAAAALLSASPRTRVGRSRLRLAAEDVDPEVVRGLQRELVRLREEAECHRLT